MHAILTLSPLAVIGTVPSVPPELRGLAQDSLDDLSAALDPCPAEWAGKALWPLVTPAYDPLTQRPTDQPGTPDAATRTVPYALEAYTPPAPPPRVLSPLEFLVLCQTAGGMTDVMLVAADADASLAPLWIKFRLAKDVERDSALTTAGLDAFAALGYLPNGKAAVLNEWPNS